MSESHEIPILILLPEGVSAAVGINTILASEDVAHVEYPPLWCMDRHGLDVPDALPSVKSVDATTLEAVLETLEGMCTAPALERLIAIRWRTADRMVHDFYLGRGIFATLGAILKIGKGAEHETPPPSFRTESIHDASFSVAYRLGRIGPAKNPQVPREEATVTAYPFDPSNEEACREHDVQAPGVVLEVFAYDAGRATHRESLERVAAANAGWRVHDPVMHETTKAASNE